MCDCVCFFLFLVITCISDDNQSAEMTECLKQTNSMPPLVQECTVPCRDDCTFTPWSKFTPCSTNCETTRSRRRQITGNMLFHSLALDKWCTPELTVEGQEIISGFFLYPPLPIINASSVPMLSTYSGFN